MPSAGWPAQLLCEGTSRPKTARGKEVYFWSRALACMGSSMGRRQALLEETSWCSAGTAGPHTTAARGMNSSRPAP